MSTETLRLRLTIAVPEPQFLLAKQVSGSVPRVDADMRETLRSGRRLLVAAAGARPPDCPTPTFALGARFSSLELTRWMLWAKTAPSRCALAAVMSGCPSQSLAVWVTSRSVV